MSALLDLLEVTDAGSGTWRGRASGPAGKRAYGGQLMAQSLAAASRTVDPVKALTSVHLQFLRGGDAGEPVDYRVEAVFDGRTAASRRVEGRQGDRLLTTASVSFAAALPGPEHGHRALPGDPAEHFGKRGSITLRFAGGYFAHGSHIGDAQLVVALQRTEGCCADRPAGTGPVVAARRARHPLRRHGR